MFLIVIDTAFLPKRDTRRTRALMAHLSLRLQWVRDEWIGRLVGVFDDDTPASFIEIQAAICRDKMLVSLRARSHQRTQCSELATDNRLVGGSSLPSPTHAVLTFSKQEWAG